MNIIALIKSFIYLISASLLYPALFLLSVFSLFIVFLTGKFLAEWLERAGLKKIQVLELEKRIMDDTLEHVVSPCVISYTQKLKKALVHNAENNDAEVQYLLQSEISSLLKTLDKIKILVRLGPGLGLIGTLVPMGTGLAGLGQGDMTKLSSDLVIAFTTTVVGLAVGLAAYSFFMFRKRWIEEDIRNIEYVTEVLHK